jgi:serine/threonine protein kinase
MATQQEMNLANAAVRGNVVGRTEMQDCLREQQVLAQKGTPKKLVDLLIERKLLTPEQVSELQQSCAAASPPAPGGQPAARPAQGTQAPAADTSKKPAPPQDPIPGYKIVGKLGSGGIATVFKAIDAAKGGDIALKIMYPHHVKNELFRNRFVRESELLCKFEHENIVKGYASGCSSGLYWLAMELVDGESIQNLLDKSGTLSEDDALRIIVQIAEAIEYMQSQSVVHRDIKPDNVLITRDGTVKLIDLGFAKPMGAAEGQGDLTCGTPQYMSPEQAQGQRDLDVRSDIYALGATLYHVVLGKTPFAGTDSLEVMAKQVIEDLATAETKGGKISRHMHYFIEKLMAKEKDIRYQSPRELIEDIETQMAGMKSLEFHPEDQQNAQRPAAGRQGGTDARHRRPGSITRRFSR